MFGTQRYISRQISSQHLSDHKLKQGSTDGQRLSRCVETPGIRSTAADIQSSDIQPSPSRSTRPSPTILRPPLNITTAPYRGKPVIYTSHLSLSFEMGRNGRRRSPSIY